MEASPLSPANREGIRAVVFLRNGDAMSVLVRIPARSVGTRWCANGRIRTKPEFGVDRHGAVGYTAPKKEIDAMQPTAEHLMEGLERRAREGFRGYPLGIVAFYGYNDRSAAKAVIGIVKEAGGAPEHVKKWVSEEGDLRKDAESIKEFFRHIEAHDVRSVALTPGIYYCPHEPGIDYPEGGSCPHCPFWSNVRKPDLFKPVQAAPARNQDRPGRLLKMLTEAARNRKTLPYGDVMREVGLSYGDAAHRKIFARDLRTAVRESEIYPHDLILSALLVYQTQHFPEDDFFAMAQELGLFAPGKDSKTVFFEEHLERVFQYFEKNK